MRIAVVDYGAGNLASVVKALGAVGATTCVVNSARQISGADAIVVPGVGHFAATAQLAGETQGTIRACVAAGVPLLGICLGMQWLFEGSEEAPGMRGLGLLSGSCTRLSNSAAVKVPHVGWNTIDSAAESRLLCGLPAHASVYFSHTYAPPDGEATVARTTHGATFTSVVEQGRVFGTQFHPEKSGATGLRILAAFVAIASEAGVRC